MRWLAGHTNVLAMGRFVVGWLNGISWYEQRISFWTTTCIFHRETVDRGKILGKDLDRCPVWNITSKITTCIFGRIGFTRKWRINGERKEEDKEGERQREKGDFYSSYTPMQNFCAKQVFVIQEGIFHNRKISTLVPEHSILMGLTLEIWPLKSFCPMEIMVETPFLSH